ncbi:hypothetical protein PPERSA_05956 [Pseudocohnilembus persalinus]|uniref:RRM domain-containing protein n=1 Tax=Pseudocohnilembus persalinus TaxID=266149 RepID=A0A0V0R492_PSEPJ|nr:hypothetical protein PPERSA_05956 [Pseudocohnilembus persalinus]|eukprot:KRX09287.1 hypothetical protein PPERSA_05956 [Pseudocohnilembus persalinus]
MGRSRSRSKSASKKKSKKDKRSKKSKKYTRSRSRSKSYRSYSNSPRRYKNRDRDRDRDRDRSRDEDYYRSKNEPSQWLYIQDIQDDLTQEIIENAFQDVSIQAGTSLPDEVRMVVFFKQVFIQYPSVASASKVLYHQKGKIQINGFTYNMDFYVNEQQKQAQLTIPAYLDSTQDWMCEKCDYKNFAKRTRCHKCDRPKSQVCKALITPAQIKPQVIENVQNTSLMVRGNVITQVTETQLLDIFQKFSQVKDIRLVKNKTTGAQRDFAFVEFFTVEEAEKVLEQTERDLRINGQDVHVLYSKSKNETSGGSSSGSYSTQQQQQLQYYNYIQQQQQPQIENIQNPDAAYYQQSAAYYQNYQGQQGQQSQYQQQIYQPIDPNNPQIQQYNQQILHPQMPQQQVPLPPQPPQPQQQPSQDSYQSAYMSIQEDQESLRKKEEQKRKDDEILQQKKLEAEKMLQKKLKQEKELQEKLRRQQEDPLIKKQREEEELRKKEEEKKKQQEKEQKEKELQEKINRQKKAEQELKKWEKRQKFQAMAPDSPQQQDQQQNQDQQAQMQQNDDKNQVQNQIKNQQQQKSVDDNKTFLIICSICKKKFKSQEILRQHDKYSESHKNFLKQIEVGV